MDDSLLPDLRRTAFRIVWKASKPGGSLERGEFTMAIARRAISEAMGFGEDSLEEKEWKAQVKAMVQDALEKVSQERNSQSSPGANGAGSDSTQSDEDSEEYNTKPKAKARGKAKLVEAEVELEASDSGSSFAKVMKKRKKDVKSSSKRQSGASKASGNKASHREETPQSLDNASEEEEDAAAQQSESEMSSVYDVPPSRKRGKTENAKSTDGAKGKKKRKSGVSSGSEDERPRSGGKAKANTKRKKKDPNEGLSPDEARVADLKRIVVACGVRKQWAKEFADCKTTRDQRTKLEQMLRSLGMHGQPSLGKAKAIKEKRELAAELNDVREFEAARGLSGDRASRSKKQRYVQSDYGDSDEDGDGDDDDEDGPKETSALDAVMDFLGNDSGSD